MAVTTSNFKNGMCIITTSEMWIIVEFQHVKPGKGGAFVRTKLKELKVRTSRGHHVPCRREARRCAR